MAYSYTLFTGNGSTTQYAVAFGYIRREHVAVTVAGSSATFTWINNSLIQMDVAPANGAAVRVYRVTPLSAPLVDFTDGATLVAADLDTNAKQSIYTQQELDDELVDGLAAVIPNGDKGDITTSVGGSVWTIDAGAVTSAKILDGAVTSAKILDGTILNADINASAAIAATKLAFTPAGGVAATTVQAAIEELDTEKTSLASPTFTGIPAAPTAAAGTNTTQLATTAYVVSQAVAKTGGTMTGDLVVPSLNGGPIAGTRNRIINGDMRIDQRNAGASVTVASGGVFITDRWESTEDTDGTMTAQQSTTAPAGFTSSLLFTTGTADASLGASQYVFSQQKIEGFNVADLGWGTASAQSITLSFWVQSSLTGTFGGALRNSASNRSYPFTYTISAANTWEQKSVTIAGDTTGTWVTNNGAGILLGFGLGVGSSFSGTAGAWNSNNNISATGAISVIGTTGATFFITGVQLEPGSVATPFERRSFGAELALCQRYYCQWTASNELQYDNYQASGADGIVFVSHPVQMRATPTLTIIGSIPTTNAGAAALTAISALRSQVRATASSAGRTQIFNAINNGFSASAEF